MKTTRTTSVEDYKIVSSFQSLRKTLLDERYAERLEKPLAYWAMPNDRRLPLAFLGRTLKELLDTPFDELSATPGIGQKKISSLVKLLSRATKDHPPAVPFGILELRDGKKGVRIDRVPRTRDGFDASIVSEALWSLWRETVRKHGLENETLGRLAPSLQSLPTVIWHTPLGYYVDYTVSEIRQLKTHGEKRVRVVLEVFSIVHEAYSNVRPEGHLSLRLMPKFVLPIEEWIRKTASEGTLPSPAEVRERVAHPLLEQVEVDAGPAIYELAAGRLGVNGKAETVRQQAKDRKLTRARVYQLLEDCARIMDVRWPEGKQMLPCLGDNLRQIATPDDNLRLLMDTVDLFFPNKNKGEGSPEEDGEDDD